MGGGLEADLSQGAVPALWSPSPLSAMWARSHPVLQVVDVSRPAKCPWYRLLLSDGVHSQHASLVSRLDHLVSAGALRRGSVVRFLKFVGMPDSNHVRTIFINELEILQTECAMIGSLKLYMGGGLVAVLSEGAVRALWGAPPLSAKCAATPVLQVVDVTRVPDGSSLRPGRARYRLLLSDGVYSQHATLARALNPLAKGDDIRPGSIVCLLSFVHHPDPDHVRTIFITELEILQTECALIGSLKLYKPPRNSGLPGSHWAIPR